MATKTISITEEAYDILKSKKATKESFSDIIVKLSGKKSLLSFFGILNKEEGERLEKNIRESRATHRRMHIKRLKR